MKCLARISSTHQIHNNIGLLQQPTHALSVSSFTARTVFVNCSHRKRNLFTQCCKVNHYHDKFLHASGEFRDRVLTSKHARDDLCLSLLSPHCLPCCFHHNLNVIFSSYVRCITEIEGGIRAFSSATKIWVGYWIGPDIEDGWGYVKSFVSEIC